MITNTAKDEVRPEWTMGGNPRAIEAQEARGQKELESADVLPTKIREDMRSILKQRGVKFGEPVKGDRLFTHVTLPAGWKKQATGHSMWTDLFDDKGEKVCSMFYKAAFYDRDAFI